MYTRYVKNIVAGCLIVASSSIVAATINFPGPYPTLQATVNAAVSGDTINITANINGGLPGNHDVAINGKTLTFTGNGHTINLGSSGRLFNITSSNVTIQNWGIQNGSSTSVGGAIYNDSSSTLTISNCTFNYNTATTNGGAIYNATGARLNVSNSTFGTNTATTDGGAIYNAGIATLDINCSFTGNSAASGGAIYNDLSSTLTISACTFNTNTATTDGGAIYNAGIATLDTGCSFTGNRAASGCGGAIYDAAGATLNVLSSTFDSNTAPNYDSGAIEGRGTLRIESCDFSNNSALDAGAIMIRKISNSLVKNCSFNNNNASYAGAFYNNGTVALENCIFIGNRSDHGGAICGFSGNLSIDRCVFIKNSATAEGGAIVLYSVGSFTMGCCRFAGNTAVTGGDAIYSDTWINAFNNWWGTNTPTVPDLISDRINYNPWITASLTRLIPEGMDTSIKMTFSSGCLPDGTPVAFSTTDGIITHTLALTVDGVATTTLSGYGALQLTLTVTIGPDAEDYVVSNIATSVPVNPYRFNFGCICSDTGEEHILIGSHNMPSLDGNSLDFWVFNETPTASFIHSLDLGQQIIMDSATYNTDLGMNIAVLTQTQQGNTSIVLVTYDGASAVLQSTTPLSSQAFKAQWFVSPDSTPYIIVDAQDSMSLYEVDLGTYDLTLSSSVPNLGAGIPSTFLRWYPQGDSIYVIQCYNKTSIATYKVDLTTGIIESGVPTDLSTAFTAVHSCATCYGDLVLGGAGSGGLGVLIKYTIDVSGALVPSPVSRSIAGTTAVHYCERCCCGNNPILVGTDYGLYSLNADTLDIIASNTLMPNNNWINTCWCCDVTGDYCIAVNSNHETYVFQQAAPLLNMVLQLPN
jgi:predicted outer membrane repeat protein